MDKFFDNFYNYAGFGPSIDVVIPTESFCDDYRGVLPDQLIDYWQQYGFSGWGEGLFWIVNPSEYAPILQAWLEGTSFEDKDDYHVIARTAFGKLLVWSNNCGHCLSIQSLYGLFYPSDESMRIQEKGTDFTLQLFFSSSQKNDFDILSSNESFLFSSAKNQLGRLNSSEIYAFVPALALGGQAKLDNLKKVNALEHLALLADLGEKRIMHDVNQVLGPAKSRGQTP